MPHVRLKPFQCRDCIYTRVSYMATGPTSLNGKWQAGDIHESFREQEKYCNCSLVTTHQMHESALVLKDHLCKEPTSFDGKWQAKRFPTGEKGKKKKKKTAALSLSLLKLRPDSASSF